MERRLDREKYLEYVYPEHKPDHSKPERESIVKLGKMITDRIPQKLGIKKITRDDPEYWGLAGVVTDEEAQIALKMGVRKPKTLPEMVKLTGIPARELEPKLQEMSVKGILEYNWENPRREKQYMLPMYVPGSAEFFNMNRNVMEEHPEVTLFFEHMSRLPLEHVTPFVGEGGTCTFNPSPDIIHGQKTIYGSWVTSLWKMEELVERLVRWGIHPEDLITHEFPIEKASEAYRLTAEGQCGKVAVTFPE